MNRELSEDLAVISGLGVLFKLSFVKSSVSTVTGVYFSNERAASLTIMMHR